ncbi:competence protein [Bacillus sp. HMF5848]|uniref:competence protein ComK n=1 Tax=Bacillus sp. HMF5848 TaxID=2495421 RepID=UPI000F778113|nr:competence protein ComK [Bacillus sp. HMF5848]RSK26352.1 competence protein [Bacillus sp. HMF5848]
MKHMTMKMLEEYEVNRYTMAIIPERFDKQKFSRVIELEGEFVVTMSPQDIVERSCNYFGSSLRGRIAGTKAIMGITHKSPIVVDYTNGIYLFPTTSPRQEKCAWISHAYVEEHRSNGSHNTTVIFKNNRSFHFPVSFGSFENQLYRTAQLRTKLTSRIEGEDIRHSRRKSFIIDYGKKREFSK